MLRFLDFTDAVDRILLRQLGNTLLWVATGGGLAVTVFLNEMQRATTRWPTENLLAGLNLVVELSLIAAVAAILIYERFWMGRQQSRGDATPSGLGYTFQLHLAAVLLLLVVAALHLVALSYYQYLHLLTVLQRGFLIWLTAALVPTAYLLANPRARGGWLALVSFVFALAVMLGAEWLVVALSAISPAWERLGDVYYWNQLYPHLAQERLWLVIYNPWLGWYFLGYLGANLALYLGLVLRVRALHWREAGETGTKA